MLRITKQTDYGIVLLTLFARERERLILTASELARRAELPQPTVTKVLKLIARAGLLISHRGVQGGYRLARRAEEISIADVIDAIEGPIALTQCSADHGIGCDRADCPGRPTWRRLDRTIKSALAAVTIAEMAMDQVDLVESGEM